MESDSLQIAIEQLHQNQEEIAEQLGLMYWALTLLIAGCAVPIAWGIGTIRDRLANLIDLNNK